MSQHVISWEDVPEEVDACGIGRRRLERPGMSLVRVRVPQGIKGTKHSHPHEQVVHVLSGSGQLTTEAGKVAFCGGSIFVFPRDTWHIADFDADSVLVESNLPG